MKRTQPLRTSAVARFTGESDLPGTIAAADFPTGHRTAEYDFLLHSGVVWPKLSQAVADALRLNVEPHEVLLSTRAIEPQVYIEAVANSIGVQFLRPGQPPLGPTTLVDGTDLPPRMLAAMAHDHRARGQAMALATPEVLDSLEIEAVRGARLKRAVRGLRRLDPELSAAGPIRLWQLIALLVLIGLIIGGTVVAPSATRATLMACVSVPFFLVVLFRVVVLLTVIARKEQTPKPRLNPNRDRHLPAYSLLVPMFRETAVLPDLVEALSQLDYPAAKLDCMLVLEAADRATITAARSMTLPPFMRIVVVPDCLPRTKPKALNYAMQLAHGDFITVFDAEDVPDPQQLRKAVQAFAAGGPDVACVQASLAIHNAKASWLTRGIMAQTPEEIAGISTT